MTARLKRKRKEVGGKRGKKGKEGRWKTENIKKPLKNKNKTLI